MALEMIKKLGEEYLAKKVREVEQKPTVAQTFNETKEATVEELINYAKQMDIRCWMCKEYLEKVTRGERLSSIEEYHLSTCLSAQKSLRERSDPSLF